MRLPALTSCLGVKAGDLLQAPPGQNERWAEQLVEFYEGVLRSGLVLPSSGGLAEGLRQPSVSTQVYANILSGAASADSYILLWRLGPQRSCKWWPLPVIAGMRSSMCAWRLL